MSDDNQTGNDQKGELQRKLTSYRTENIDQQTVSAYSKHGSTAYEDALNKSFVYGEITTKFLESIQFRESDEVVLDMGSGTGFGFEIVGKTLAEIGAQGIGVEPAEGMLKLADETNPYPERLSYKQGIFEEIPMADDSVDHIISTLALHWVHDLEKAVSEMRRVLKPTGAIDILMIAIDDGAAFKRSVVAALRKHLTFAQIMKTAGLVQRRTTAELEKAFSTEPGGPFEGFELVVENPKDLWYGSFEKHMKWWKARSSAVIADVEDREGFMKDLEVELAKTATDEGIPFDSSCFFIRLVAKS